MNIAQMIEKVQQAMKSYHIGIGVRNFWVVDNETNGKKKKFGTKYGDLVSFNLDIEDSNQDMIAVPNEDNTRAKVYMLVEVCDIEITDNSLDM